MMTRHAATVRVGSSVSWFTRRMADALDGLDKAERLACRVAERVTGASARALRSAVDGGFWDTTGRFEQVSGLQQPPRGDIP